MCSQISNLVLEPADIFFTQGTHWVSKAIRWFSRSKDEKPTEANHVGAVVVNGPLSQAKVVEALWKVRYGSLYEQYHDSNTKISIWRPKNIPKAEKFAIADEGLKYIGCKYGWWKILLHAIGLKRWCSFKKRPICSFLVGVMYDVKGYTFGKTPNMALDPDDIHDFCVNNPDKYELVLDWTKI